MGHMSFVTALHVLGATPLFAARACLAAFILLVVGRFGPSVPWVGDLPVVQALASSPGWLLSWPALIVAAVGAWVEERATYEPELRLLLERLDAPVSAAVFLLVQFGLVGAEGGAILRALDGGVVPAAIAHASVWTGAEPAAGGGPGALAWMWVGLCGIAVFAASTVRRLVLGVVHEVDASGALELPRIWSIAETSTVAIGALVFVLAPLLAAAFGFVVLLSLVVVERMIRRLERRTQRPCTSCREPISPMAPMCPACRTPQPAPRRPNLVGWPSRRPAREAELGALDLLAQGRCGLCATRVDGRGPGDTCRGCHGPLLPPERRAALVAEAGRRHRRSLVVVALLAVVPVLGLLPALLWLRLHGQVLRRWTPPLRSFAGRVAGRLLLIPVFAAQGVPVLGALTLPIWAVVEHRLQRRLFGLDANEDPASRSTNAPLSTAR